MLLQLDLELFRLDTKPILHIVFIHVNTKIEDSILIIMLSFPGHSNWTDYLVGGQKWPEAASNSE